MSFDRQQLSGLDEGFGLVLGPQGQVLGPHDRVLGPQDRVLGPQGQLGPGSSGWTVASVNVH